MGAVTRKQNMPKELLEREDAIAEGSEEEPEKRQNDDAASASNDKEQEQPEKEALKAVSDPDGGDGENAESDSKDKSDKPEDEPDWKQIAAKERYKRQRKNDELEALKKQLEEMQGGKSSQSNSGGESQSRTSGKPVEMPRRPKKSDPEIDYDDDKYEEAIDRYNDQVVEKKLEAKVAELEQKLEQKSKTKEIVQKRETYTDRLSEYAAKNPDFVKRYEEAGKPTLPSHVDDLLVESELGPEIEDALYGDLDALRTVLSGSAIKAAATIGRIEARLEASKGSAATPGARQKKITNAPKPISDPVPTGGSTKKVGLMKGFHFAS
jgi:hypothetical protein